MRFMPVISRTVQAASGALLILILSLPACRETLEGSMQLHMLVQYPLVMFAGVLLALAVPQAVARTLSSWNAMGIAGLTAAMLFMTVLMIPRVVDLALVDARVEAAKFAALLFVGSVLRASWRDAGLVVQAFFLGGILPMAIVVGTLYQDAPLRLCNAYGLDDQRELGWSLVCIGVAIAVIWLVGVARIAIASDVDTGLIR